MPMLLAMSFSEALVKVFFSVLVQFRDRNGEFRSFARFASFLNFLSIKNPDKN
jgi:hypothetical protein